MKRRVYLICQKSNWDKGKPQVLSDGYGKLCYVFACDKGLKRATRKVKELNKKVGKNPVHLRKAILIIEEELKPRRVTKPSSPRGKK